MPDGQNTPEDQFPENSGPPGEDDAADSGEHRFRFSEARFERLVETLADLAGVVDDQGRWVWASPAYQRVIGTRPEPGARAGAMAHPEDRATVFATFERILDGTVAHATTTYRVWSDLTHTWLWLESTCADHRDDPAIGGLVLSTRDVTRRVEAERALRQQALHDDLTGLANRVLLRDRLDKAAARARRSDRPFAVLFFDLDHFKEVNDSLGHSTGDELLMTVADRLRRRTRDSDTLARLGGDEFVLVVEQLHEATVEDDVAAMCEVVVATVADPVPLAHRSVTVTTSIGVVVSHGTETVDDLLRDADIAMYEAKATGRDRWVRHDSWMSLRARAQFEARSLLVAAIDDDTVQVHYQPAVDLATGKTVGVEALARLEQDDGSLLPARDFIPIAEETGTIVPLGTAVLRRAIGALESLSTDWWLSVNVSIHQLADPDFERAVLDILAGSKVPSERLVLEITESAVVGLHHNHAIDTVDRLHAEGVRFALDDFGTGFSSVDRLRHLPVEFVKIDRSFIGRVAVIGSGDLAVVRAILGMAEALDLRVIAEGVEDHIQAEVLTHLGIPFAQGHLFGLPQAGIASSTSA